MTLTAPNRPEKTCGGFLVAALVAFLVFRLLVASGQRGGETFSDNGWLAGTMGGALACILVSGVVGVVAVTRRHERSIDVFAAIAVAAFAGAFLLGEILVPH